MDLPDFSKLAWQLNVALIGAVFSGISLIYNEKYIYYGLITFLFGVISHFLSTWFEFVYSGEDKMAKRARFYYIQTVLILIWVGTLLVNFLGQSSQVQTEIPQCVAGHCPKYSIMDVNGNDWPDSVVIIPTAMNKGWGKVWIIEEGKVIFESPEKMNIWVGNLLRIS